MQASAVNDNRLFCAAEHAQARSITSGHGLAWSEYEEVRRALLARLRRDDRDPTVVGRLCTPRSKAVHWSIRYAGTQTAWI